MGKVALASSLVVLLAIGSASAKSVSPTPRGRIVFVSSRAIPVRTCSTSARATCSRSMWRAAAAATSVAPAAKTRIRSPSPDGKLIAFVRESLAGERSLLLMAGDGRAQRRLVGFGDLTEP